MPRRPPGMHPFAQSGRGGPGSQAVRRVDPTTIFAYGRKVAGVPLQPGQAQTILSSGPSSGITRGQPSSLVNATNASSVVWPANPAAGQTILIALVVSSGQTITSLVDNGTSPTTFTLDVSESANGQLAQLWRANAISLPSSGTYAVNITTSGGHEITGGGVAYSGVKAGPPTATNVGTSAASGAVSAGPVTPAAAGALYFAGFGDSSGATETITLTAAGFIQQFVQNVGASAHCGAIADKIDATGPTATTATWTLSDTPAWSAAIAVYDAAAAGPALPAGSGQVTLGPIGVGSVWYPASVTVSTTTGALDSSTFNLYLGPAGVPVTLVGTLFPGGAGTIALAIPPMSPGQYLIGVWSGGHPGDVASMNVIGSMDAVTL